MLGTTPLSPDTAVENRGPVILAVMYSSTALSSLLVAGRLFSRHIKLGRWAADDYIILVSLVRTTLTCLVFLSIPGKADRETELTPALLLA